MPGELDNIRQEYASWANSKHIAAGIDPNSEDGLTRTAKGWRKYVMDNRRKLDMDDDDVFTHFRSLGDSYSEAEDYSGIAEKRAALMRAEVESHRKGSEKFVEETRSSHGLNQVGARGDFALMRTMREAEQEAGISILGGMAKDGRMPFHIVKAVVTGLQVPQRLPHSDKINAGISKVLGVDPAAQEMTFQERFDNAKVREVYGLPGLHTPGEKHLSAMGMHPVLAELIAGEILDPMAWAGGKPLSIMTLKWGLQFGRFSARHAVQAARGLRNIPEGARSVSELAASWRGVLKVQRDIKYTATMEESTELVNAHLRMVDDLAGTPKAPQAELSKAQVLEKGIAAEGTHADLPFGGTGSGSNRTSAFREAIEEVANQRKVVRSAEAEVKFGQLFKQMDSWEKAEILKIRLQQVTTKAEQLFLEKHYGNQIRLPKEWYNKEMLKETYRHNESLEEIKIGGGIEDDFMRNAHKYIDMNEESLVLDSHGRIPADTRALGRALGINVNKNAAKPGVAAAERSAAEAKFFANLPVGETGNPAPSAVQELLDKLFDLKQNYTWVPRDADLARTATAMATHNNSDELGQIGYLMSKLGQRHATPQLQNTPIGQSVLKAQSFRELFYDGHMEKLRIIFGSVARVSGATRRGLLETAGKGYRLSRTKHPLFADRASAVAREWNDHMWFGMDDEVAKVAINARRLKEKLPSITLESLAAQEDKLLAVNRSREWMDDLGKIAVDNGVLHPRQLLSEYMPRVRKLWDNRLETESLEEIIRKLSDRIPAHRKEAIEPMLAMLRSGDIAPDDLDFVRIMEAYTRQLAHHVKFKPILDQAFRLVEQAAATKGKPGFMGMYDKQRALQYLRQYDPKFTTEEQMVFSLKARLLGDEAAKAGGKRAILANEIMAQTGGTAFEQKVRWAGRQSSRVYMQSFIGLKAGLAGRNTLQQFNVLPMLGRGLKTGLSRLQYLTRGSARFVNDPLMQERFAATALEQGWVKGFTEFSETMFTNAVKKGWLPEDLAQDYLHFFRMADMNSRVNSFAGAIEYTDDLLVNLKGGGEAYKEALKILRPADRAVAQSALRDYAAGGENSLQHWDEFSNIFARHAVNESQYLYNSANAPFIANKVGNSMMAAMRLFQSWGMHYREGMINHMRAASSSGGLETLKGPGLKAGMEWLTPLIVTGVGADVVGNQFGLDLGRWFFEDTSEELMAWSKRNGVPMYDKNVFNPKALNAIQFMDDTVLGSTAEAFKELGDNIHGAIWNSHERVSVSRVARARRSLPIHPLFTETTTQIGLSLGVNANTRSGPERFLAGTLGVPQRGTRRSKLGAAGRWLEAAGVPVDK